MYIFSPRTEGKEIDWYISYSDLFLSPRLILTQPDGFNGVYITAWYVEAPLSTEDKIRKVARELKIDEELFLRVAKCESGFKLDIKNPLSTASGVFQFLDSTFKSQSEKYGIEGEKDSDIQIQLAGMMIRDGGLNHWLASKGCWDIRGSSSQGNGNQKVVN